MPNQLLNNFFKDKNLDIRILGNNPRFLDQKCTPDVISFIADCIRQLPPGLFNRDSIWEHSYFITNASLIFGKPSPNNSSAHSEYDKLILQPLDMLAYAGVLSKTKQKNKNYFRVVNQDLLEYISLNEKNAFNFLYYYLSKFAKDSGLQVVLDAFLQQQNDETFDNLRQSFIRFMRAYTRIGTKTSNNGGQTEIRRIFPKFLNVFAVGLRIQGVEKGRRSRGIFLFPDLMYNRVNFRDVKKLKNMTRQEQQQARYSRPKRYIALQMQKAMQWMKLHHPYSEVKDKYFGRTDAIHHIFPRAQYPSISYYIENLIALTAAQHTTLAHPHGNTKEISKSYQHICLQAKSKTIEDGLLSGRTQYNLNDFLWVLHVGFGEQEDMFAAKSFQQIRKFINSHYE